VLGGVVLGLVVAGVGVWLWIAANTVFDVEMGWLAVPIGAAVGAAVAVGAASRSRIAVPLLAIVITLLSSVLADNFFQRASLISGIETLQTQWADLKVEPIATVPPEGSSEDVAEGPGSASGTSTTVAPTSCPANSDLVPPAEIVKVLPLAAYDCMTPKILAVIYADVPDEIKPQLPPTLKADAEALLASEAEAAESEATSARDQAARAELDAARAQFQGTTYDIPAPVLACAPPPDLTQPTAMAGLGFPNGVPLVLPLGDLFSGPLARGDGQSYEAPSPACFAAENAKEHPLHAASWVLGAVLAGAVAFVMRRRPARAVLPPAAA